MKKELAILLVFGLLLMGVIPVLAAGEQVKAAHLRSRVRSCRWRCRRG
ncbi:hypothetical protein Marky_2108 [Marinithermus hydrothermalis DSM 14884]|uniref:Uncharacterized protein n=1 Tax=Marinithermus hydrothermalis (strain DSM 14884 / JCM 11576 / T1) TaxID=869210 RepID=F2NPQ7_MARHT|nr:hypothetical protein Marky_2108 [Marinithermus hydrothermalis DSM 14884]